MMGFGERLPDFTIRDIDRGFVKYVLGAVERRIKEENAWYCDIAGLKQVAGSVPVRIYMVIVSHAEIFSGFELPAVVVKRRWGVAKERLFSVSWLYRIPIDEAHFEERVIPVPVDVFYTVNLMARYHGDMIVMWQHFMKRWQYPFLAIRVDLSEDKYTTYECHIESISDISEIVDIAEKIMAVSVEFKVLGELPLADPIVRTKIEEIKTTVKPI